MLIEKHKYSTPDNQKIFSQVFLPDTHLAGIVLVIHGLGEHSGRYASHFAEFFTKNHLAISVFDLPGHGQSFGPKGHFENPYILLEIIDDLLKANRDRFPDVPHFIYGHSLGGEIALWYTLVRKPDVKGVILSAPLIGTKDPVPFLKFFLAKTLEKIWPSFSMDNGLRTDLLSKDEEIVKAYQSDPLVHRKVSARTGMMIINRGEWIKQHICENRNRILIMVGDQEGIVNPDAIELICASAPTIQLKIWPGLYHELHNEPEKYEVMRFSIEWMKKSHHVQ